MLIPISYFLFKGKQKEKIFQLLAFYGILFCFLLNIFFPWVTKEFTKYFYTIYTTLEYFFFVAIFYVNIKSKTARTTLVVTSILFFVFQTIYVLTQKFKRLDTIPVGIETILIFLIIFYYIYEYSQSNSKFSISNNYCFLMALGILIYLGGSFFFYLMIDQLSRSEVDLFGNLTYAFEIIKNLLFATSIMIYLKKKNPEIKRELPNLDFTL